MNSLFRIFVSYRRDDSQFATDWICERLSASFGRDKVIRDVDTIPLGVDFRQYIANAVEQCQVLLAVIGNAWLAASDEEGRRRLDDPRDFVRGEIEAALRRGLRVIPVTLARVRVPSAKDLPPDLQELSYRNGIAIRPEPDFNNDIVRLIEALKRCAEGPRLPSGADLDQLGKEHMEALTSGRSYFDRGEVELGYAAWRRAIRTAEAVLEPGIAVAPIAVSNARIGIGVISVQLANKMIGESRRDLLEEAHQLVQKGIPHLQWCVTVGLEIERCHRFLDLARQVLNAVTAKLDPKPHSEAEALEIVKKLGPLINRDGATPEEVRAADEFLLTGGVDKVLAALEYLAESLPSDDRRLGSVRRMLETVRHAVRNAGPPPTELPGDVAQALKQGDIVGAFTLYRDGRRNP